jgi:hypothetical protein
VCRCICTHQLTTQQISQKIESKNKQHRTREAKKKDGWIIKECTTEKDQGVHANNSKLQNHFSRAQPIILHK